MPRLKIVKIARTTPGMCRDLILIAKAGKLTVEMWNAITLMVEQCKHMLLVDALSFGGFQFHDDEGDDNDIV
jgi:hypothetical protein